MTLAVDNSLAKQFVEAALETKDARNMKAAVSEAFKCISISGQERVEWSNIHEMIGAFKMTVWPATIKNLAIRQLKNNKLEVTHLSEPKIDSTWTFEFEGRGAKRKISHAVIENFGRREIILTVTEPKLDTLDYGKMNKIRYICSDIC